jgi:transketolase
MANPDIARLEGIAESGMIGLAAGLALTGRVPFACSFACFIVGRFETIRVSVAYTQAPVKLVGTHVAVAELLGRRRSSESA